MAVMRTRKDGGCSLCNAADENVGKRKCCHILDNATMMVRKEKSTNFIDISGKYDNNDVQFSVKATQKKIKNYISTLSAGLSEKDQESILSILREE